MWGDGEILFVLGCDFLCWTLTLFVGEGFVGFGSGLGVTPVTILVYH